MTEYRLVALVGQGGMGEVWQARHGPTGAVVALKRLRATRHARRHAEEVRAIAALGHPHVVRILDQGVDEPWFAMPWADGSLAGPRLAWRDARPVLRDALSGLAHAHGRGRLHLDLKPSNLLRYGARTVIADFGVSRAALDDDGADLGWGSRGFVAPEQAARSWRDLGPSTDLYALGATAWALLTGRPPDDALRAALASGTIADERLPDGIGDWFAALLAPAPEDRFPDAAAALAALGALGDPDRDALLDGADAEGAETMTRSAVAPRVTPARPSRRAWPRPPSRRPSEPLEEWPVGTGLSLLGFRDAGVIGRAEERAALWAHLERVVGGGAPSVVAVRGPAGAGRSRLLRWLAEAAAEAGLADVTRVSAADGSVPLALGRRLRVGGLAWSDVVERLRRRYAEPEALATVLADGPAPGPALVAGALSCLASARPVVIAIDDAHRIGGVAEIVGEVLRRGDAAVLFALSWPDEARADDLEALLDGDRCAVRVAPLPDSDLERLLRDHLRLDPHLSDALVVRARGNPALALSAVAHYADRGWLAVGARGLVLTERAPAVPDALARPWSQAVADVHGGDPALREALERAAVLGARVDEAEWAAVAPDEAAREAVTDGLLARRLAERTDGGWTFVHDLSRGAVLAEAAREGRLPAHQRACADALAARGADRGRVGALRLAAGDAAAAVDDLLAGAVARFAGNNLREVAALLDDTFRALDLQADHGPRRAMARGFAAHLASLRGRPDEAEAGALLVLAQGLGEASPPVGYARRVLASVALQRGRREEALAAFQAARATYAAADDPHMVAVCDLDVGGVLLGLGRLEEAEHHLDAAWERFREDGSDALRASTLIARSRLRLFRGDHAAATAATQAAVAVLGGRTSPALAIALNDLGLHALRAGDLPGAEGPLLASERMMRDLGFYAIGHPRLNLARVDHGLGRYDAAQARLHAVPDGPAVATPQMRALRLALQAAVAARRGDLATLERAVEGLEAAGPLRDGAEGDVRALAAEAAAHAPAALAARLDAAGLG